MILSLSPSRLCRIALPVLLGCALTAQAQEADGYRLDLTYNGEFWRNARGGLEQGNRYLDKLLVGLSIDREPLKFFTSGMYTNGSAFSKDLVGTAQGISNIETSRALRLFEAWADWQLTADGSLKFGLYDLNSEFDVTDTALVFVNPSHGIGPDFSQSGLNGPSIFPVTSLALRARVSKDDWTYQFAVLDGVPGDPAHDKHTAVKLSREDGLLWVGELQRDFERLNLKAGYWRYTASFDDLTETQADGSPWRHDGNAGYYLIAEGQLYREDDAQQGLSVFWRQGSANAHFNEFQHYTGIGASYTGLLPQRGEDVLGLALAEVSASRFFVAAQAAQDLGTDARERIYELTYRAMINDWLTLQPDVQYIQNPGLDSTLADTWAVGLRFTLTAGWGKGR